MQLELNDKINMTLIIAPLLLQLIGLAVNAIFDSYVTKTQRNILYIILALELILVGQNMIEYFLNLEATFNHTRILVGVTGYIIRPLVLVMFIMLVSSKPSHKMEWFMVVFNAVVYSTAFFSRLAFGFTETNVYIRGPLGYTCHIISAILLAELFYLTLKEYGSPNIKSIIIPTLNIVIIVAAVIADTVIARIMLVGYLTIAIVSATLFYYIWLHIRYVKEREEGIKAEQRIRLMMSQIQPHFLYNTLSTIQSLCRINPEKAGEVTENFGTYLRQNLDSLSQTDLIPLSKALEHTKVYAEIEAVRFPKIKVEYDIQDSNFRLPALTIQPLVENSIRHGVRGMENGVVTVSTRRAKDHHEIIVKDNGKGFDTEKLKQKLRQNDLSHIGLRNVKERIESMCNGTMEINSKINEGTTITIKIPISAEEYKG